MLYTKKNTFQWIPNILIYMNFVLQNFLFTFDLIIIFQAWLLIMLL